MDLIASWLLFPALLLLLCAGCGLLVDRACGRCLPPALVPAAGLAAITVLATALMLADETAEAAAPVSAAVAALGLVTALAGRVRVHPCVWAPAAGAAAFAVYAAPIVLSGDATIAGFVKLDDTATWLAFTDHIAEHGRDLRGLSPSTYEAALALNVGEGYPIGAFVPLAIGSSLTGIDPAWLIQPYMAFLAALLALALWTLAAPLEARPGLRFAACAIGAQPALLFGYYLWGGLKEVLAATLLAALVALAVPALGRSAPGRAVIAPALAAAALISALSAGGAIWLIAPAAGMAAVLLERAGLRVALWRLGSAGLLVALLSIPTLLAGGLRPPTSSPLDDPSALGNLAAPLEPVQLAGIWGEGDFRFAPADELATYVLAAVACVAAVGAVAWAVRARRFVLPLYVLGVLAGCAVLAAVGSPWVEAKGFATASAAIPFAALVGASLLAGSGRVLAGAAVGLAVAGGVLWSNALAYREVSLAPRAQLEELERIGALVAGAGPTLITEYSPYGARHFLRDGEPESISDLRRREVTLRDGSTVPKGGSADTDRIDPSALSVYRSLVVRRSPAQSRPPSVFELTWQGGSYELWQRRPDVARPLARVSLGDGFDPVAVPPCRRVRRVVAHARPDTEVIAAARPRPVVIPLSRASYPDEWAEGRRVNDPRPVSAGTLAASVHVPRAGEYELWLRGSVRARAEARIDGRALGTVHHELSNAGGYVTFGSAPLARGRHHVEVEFDVPGLAPGGAGPAGEIGPLALTTGGADDARLVRVKPKRAPERICGRPWDWLELTEAAARARVAGFGARDAG